MAVRSALQQPIAVSAIDLGEEEEALVLEVLRSGQLAQGPMVQRLEAGFCDVASTRHAVAVSSGTTALAVALEALGIGAGDEVITARSRS
jgi:dTDP-4-amino-4,6-dideoxygalactose transaminase